MHGCNIMEHARSRHVLLTAVLPSGIGRWMLYPSQRHLGAEDGLVQNPVPSVPSTCFLRRNLPELTAWSCQHNSSINRQIFLKENFTDCTREALTFDRGRVCVAEVHDRKAAMVAGQNRQQFDNLNAACAFHDYSFPLASQNRRSDVTQGFQEKVFLRIMMEIPAKN